MPVAERLTEEELALAELLRHPIWIAEFIRNFDIPEDEPEKKWVHTEYQKQMLCDFNSYVSLCCGRAVGKSECIIDKIFFYMMNMFYDETTVITVPNKVHLDPLFLKLTKYLRHNTFLQHFTDRNSINNADFTIKLKNRFILDCRIAGKSGTGANVVGLHVPFLVVDEAGYYPWGTYSELLPILNTFQRGFQLFISGVPDGRRERSVLYNADQLDNNFSKHRVSAHQNPRYTVEDEQRNLTQFKGKTSEEYVHMVLGQHGLPAYSMFDRDSMLIQNYEIYTPKIKGIELKEDPLLIYQIAKSFPKIPPYYEDIIIGIDLGYTEPSVFTVLYSYKGKWHFIARATLQQVDYPIQEKLVGLLFNQYQPTVIGIDAGGPGKNTVQHLTMDDQYSHFADRVVGIEFGGTIPIGLDEEGKEIEIRTKQFGMSRLQAMTNNHEIVYSLLDEEMIGELERTTYTRTATSGEVRYVVESLTGRESRGDDHNTAALVCALLAWYLKFETDFDRKVKLLDTFSWGARIT